MNVKYLIDLGALAIFCTNRNNCKKPEYRVKRVRIRAAQDRSGTIKLTKEKGLLLKKKYLHPSFITKDCFRTIQGEI